MVLEDILSRSWELSRYRRPPLGQWLDGFCDWLHEQCYSHTTIREHLCEVSHFNEFLRQLGIGDCRQLERLRADRITDKYVRKRGRQTKRVRAGAIRGLLEWILSS